MCSTKQGCHLPQTCRYWARYPSLHRTTACTPASRPRSAASRAPYTSSAEVGIDAPSSLTSRSLICISAACFYSFLPQQSMISWVWISFLHEQRRENKPATTTQGQSTIYSSASCYCMRFIFGHVIVRSFLNNKQLHVVELSDWILYSVSYMHWPYTECHTNTMVYNSPAYSQPWPSHNN